MAEEKKEDGKKGTFGKDFVGELKMHQFAIDTDDTVIDEGMQLEKIAATGVKAIAFGFLGRFLGKKFIKKGHWISKALAAKKAAQGAYKSEGGSAENGSSSSETAEVDTTAATEQSGENQ